ncbi:MAG: phage portal protein [Clostridiales bacterium]|nr:phage portal protein [Clostridiales bacterium]
MAFFGKKNAQDWLEELMGTVEIKDKSRAQQAKIKELAIYTAVGLLADLIAGCEIKVLEGGKPVKNAAWYMFNVSANPNQSAKELIYQWVMYSYYNGEALMIPLSGNLYVADSYSVEEYPVKGNVYNGICVGELQIKRSYRADKAYLLTQNGGADFRRLVNGGFETYAEMLDASRKSYVQNSGEKYVLQTGAFPSGDSEQSRKYREGISDSLEKFFAASTAVYPATKDQTLTRLSSAANGSAATDYSTLRKDVYNVVAAALHLPVSLLDGTSTASEQIFNQALTTAVDPLAKKITAELTRKTYSREDVIYKDCNVFVDTSAIKHAEVLSVAEKIDKLISSGFMCIDEVRKRTGQVELGEDWSQTHYITKNYGAMENGTDPLKGGE